VKKSRWTTSLWAQLASCSAHTSPSMHTKAVYPSSQAIMAPSRLYSSLSQARSCLCHSMATECEEDEALRQSTRKSRCHDKEASPGERRHVVKTLLTGYDAQLEEVFFLVRWSGG
jgi:hypothetical protein